MYHQESIIDSWYHAYIYSNLSVTTGTSFVVCSQIIYSRSSKFSQYFSHTVTKVSLIPPNSTKGYTHHTPALTCILYWLALLRKVRKNQLSIYVLKSCISCYDYWYHNNEILYSLWELCHHASEIHHYI